MNESAQEHPLMTAAIMGATAGGMYGTHKYLTSNDMAEYIKNPNGNKTIQNAAKRYRDISSKIANAFSSEVSEDAGTKAKNVSQNANKGAKAKANVNKANANTAKEVIGKRFRLSASSESDSVISLPAREVISKRSRLPASSASSGVIIPQAPATRLALGTGSENMRAANVLKNKANYAIKSATTSSGKTTRGAINQTMKKAPKLAKFDGGSTVKKISKALRK